MEEAAPKEVNRTRFAVCADSVEAAPVEVNRTRFDVCADLEEESEAAA